MTLPSFTYSGVSYSLPAAGTTEFNLTTSGGKPIGFLDVSHIHVYETSDSGMSMVELFRPDDWDFNTNRTKVVLDSGVDGSTSIVIRRITPAQSPYNLVGEGTLLPSEQLNSNILFNLYVNQETLESVEAAIQEAEDALAAAQGALDLISESIGYNIVTGVGSIPAAPTDGDLVEIVNSTDIQNFSPLTGVPTGFVGEPGLSVRIRYDVATLSWQWVSYYANDTDTRYVKLSSRSSSVASTSEATVATSLAVKTAKDAADVAAAAAASAQSTANTAVANAATAQSTANTAQGTANSAASAAGTAQSTANAAMPKSGGAFTGAVTSSSTLSDVSGNLRDIPQNPQTTGYTLVVGDAGKHVSITTGGVTIPADVLGVGDAVSVYNNSTSNQTITQGSSTTVRLAGTATTGNRTLAQRGLATILCVASNEFVISGVGLS